MGKKNMTVLTETRAPHSWPQVQSRSLGAEVYLVLRDQIVAGRLSPGEFIRERAVSAALRVSRTPLREAVSRLAAEGFLEHLPNRGYRIKHEPRLDLLELYPIIAALEVLAARSSLPELDDKDRVRLRAAHRALAAAVADRNVTVAIQANEEFHRGLTYRCQNSRLQKLLEDLRVQLSAFERWSATQNELSTEALRQHREIMSAIDRRAFAEALRTLESNRMQTYRVLVGGTKPRRARPKGA